MSQFVCWGCIKEWWLKCKYLVGVWAVIWILRYQLGQRMWSDWLFWTIVYGSVTLKIVFCIAIILLNFLLDVQLSIVRIGYPKVCLFHFLECSESTWSQANLFIVLDQFFQCIQWIDLFCIQKKRLLNSLCLQTFHIYVRNISVRYIRFYL